MNRSSVLVLISVLAACSASHGTLETEPDAGAALDESVAFDAQEVDLGAMEDEVDPRFRRLVQATYAEGLQTCACTWSDHYESEGACQSDVIVSEATVGCDWAVFSSMRAELGPQFECLVEHSISFAECMARVPCDEGIRSDIEYACVSNYDEYRYNCPRPSAETLAAYAQALRGCLPAR